MLTAVFDDHKESLAAWESWGIEGAVCFHVDAHLDVMEEGIDRSGRGHVHCANFLYPALCRNIVHTLVWVLPEHLLPSKKRLSATRTLLTHWVDPLLEEYLALKETDGVVAGRLFGKDLIICTSRELEGLNIPSHRPVILDIDVDYFVRLEDDKVWQTPAELHKLLEAFSFQALTVATSVEGGYTPVWEQYLGHLCLKPDEEEQVRPLLQSGPTGEQLEQVRDSGPSWAQAAALCKLGCWEEAQEIDPAYQQTPLLRAARLFEQKRYEAALECADTVGETDRSLDKLRFFLCFFTGRKERAESIFSTMEWLQELPAPEHLKLLDVAGRLSLQLNQPQKAVERFQKACRLEPGSGVLQLALASALAEVEREGSAVQAVRRAIKRSRCRLSSVPVLSESVRLYEKLGQPALARTARRELKNLLSRISSQDVYQMGVSLS